MLKKSIPWTLGDLTESLWDHHLSTMREAHEQGHEIAAFDALLYSEERNIPTPEWATMAIIERKFLMRGRKGLRPAEAKYRQYIKDAIRYLGVRMCETGRYQERQDKFEQAFELFERATESSGRRHFAAPKDSSEVRKSFYRFKKNPQFYRSYIFHRRFPKMMGTLYVSINRKQPWAFDPIINTQSRPTFGYYSRFLFSK